MDCGVPYCHGTSRLTGAPTGCPVNNQIPDWNDLVYRGQLGRGGAQSALDQQFPGGHRPRLSGAVRGVLHAQHRRQSGHHQNHRMRDRRPRHCARAQARGAGAQDRQEGRDRRLRAGGPGLRAAARARRTRRACLRALGQGRRPAALRHPRLQDGEDPRRPPRRADAGRRRALPLRRRCRRQRAGRQTGQGARRRGARRRRREAARPADSRPRAEGHPFRHGFPAAAEPARERRAARQRRADPRHRQKGRRHRRRRHRLRLHRHLDPPGRGVGHQFRDHAAAARAREQDAHLAGLAAEAAHSRRATRKASSATSPC